METLANRDERIAAASKVVERHLLAMKKLFRVSGTAGTESLSPAERAFDAETRIGRSRRLLGTRKRHPEIEYLFAQLEHECDRAGDRMTKYKELWKLG